MFLNYQRWFTDDPAFEPLSNHSATCFESLSDELVLKIMAAVREAKDVVGFLCVSKRFAPLVWQVRVGSSSTSSS